MGMPFDAVGLSALNPIRGLDIHDPAAAGSWSCQQVPVVPRAAWSPSEGARHLLEHSPCPAVRSTSPSMPAQARSLTSWSRPTWSRRMPASQAHRGGVSAGAENRPLSSHLARVAGAQRRKFSVFLMAQRLRANGVVQEDRHNSGVLAVPPWSPPLCISMSNSFPPRTVVVVHRTGIGDLIWHNSYLRAIAAASAGRQRSA